MTFGVFVMEMNRETAERFSHTHITIFDQGLSRRIPAQHLQRI
jgi:hypothetical protein